ncbi:MAG: hypothetical protein MI743_01000 [Sneathiellales bacterium]|nr:hypothetical protein [Sneathiellales bacterium]
MKRTGRKKEWSILVFCAFLLGIFPPVLLVFDKQVLTLGLPTSFLYLYGLWALMIVFMAIGAKRRKIPPIPGKRYNSGPQSQTLNKDQGADENV